MIFFMANLIIDWIGERKCFIALLSSSPRLAFFDIPPEKKATSEHEKKAEKFISQKAQKAFNSYGSKSMGMKLVLCNISIPSYLGKTSSCPGMSFLLFGAERIFIT
jgi:hypothetical protein